MFIKIPLFQPSVSPSGAQAPIANSNKTPAGTFHQLLPFPEKKHPSFTYFLYLLLNCLYQSVPAFSGLTLRRTATANENL